MGTRTFYHITGRIQGGILQMLHATFPPFPSHSARAPQCARYIRVRVPRALQQLARPVFARCCFLVLRSRRRRRMHRRQPSCLHESHTLSFPPPIVPHPNRRRQPPHFAKCGGEDADRGREDLPPDLYKCGGSARGDEKMFSGGGWRLGKPGIVLAGAPRKAPPSRHILQYVK